MVFPNRAASRVSPAIRLFLIAVVAVGLVCPSAAADADAADGRSPEFGVDVSYPMHHTVSTNYPWLPHNVDHENHPTPPRYVGMPLQPLGNMKAPYDRVMESCREHNPKDPQRCDANEAGRMSTNRRQPQSMKNFTDAGYKKIRTPEPLMKLVIDFWELNRDKNKTEPKAPNNIFTNSYDSPSFLLDVGRPDLPGGGTELRKKLWDAARDTVQEWTGQKLVPSSLYGIRVYTDGAILAPHVDRLPLVSSAIINVAQDVDEDWPLEVIGHDGVSENVTMAPGDFVLYESHSVIHGRPFALKGKFYANIFIHFVPEEIEEEGEVPSYVVPGSPIAMERLAQKGKKAERPRANVAADKGEVNQLQVLALSGDDMDGQDSNGWRPLHEAVRSGRTDAVEFLLDHGVNANARTGIRGNGQSALFMSIHKHGKGHRITKLLESHGARSIRPGRLERDSNGRTELHRAAGLGDLQFFQSLMPSISDELDTEDWNGWRPLHEAARSGCTEVVDFLLGQGADVNARTLQGRGGTALNYALRDRGEDHPVARSLQRHGGVDVEADNWSVRKSTDAI